MSFEDTVRSELQRAGGVIPTARLDLDRALARGRSLRRRKMAATMATAAALIAVAVGGGALLTSSRPDPGPAPAGDPSATPTPTATTSLTEDETGDASMLRYDDVEPVLREWLDALRESDEDRAWALMTAEAQATIGRSTFDQLMASALPEGLGGFADAEMFHYVVVTSATDEAQVVAVVWGEVTREASIELAAVAIPMRVRAGETLVDEPIVDRARYYERLAVFATVSAGPLSFHSGDELTVEFADPRGVTDVAISVDDDRQPLPTEFDPESGVAAATLERDLEEGTHVATVIVHHESGRLYTEAILFEAAAP